MTEIPNCQYRWAAERCRPTAQQISFQRSPWARIQTILPSMGLRQAVQVSVSSIRLIACGEGSTRIGLGACAAIILRRELHAGHCPPPQVLRDQSRMGHDKVGNYRDRFWLRIWHGRYRNFELTHCGAVSALSIPEFWTFGQRTGTCWASLINQTIAPLQRRQGLEFVGSQDGAQAPSGTIQSPARSGCAKSSGRADWVSRVRTACGAMTGALLAQSCEDNNWGIIMLDSIKLLAYHFDILRPLHQRILVSAERGEV